MNNYSLKKEGSLSQVDFLSPLQMLSPQFIIISPCARPDIGTTWGGKISPCFLERYMFIDAEKL